MKITTITISEEVKKILEELKGNKSWNEFLKELAEMYKNYKVIIAKEVENLFEDIDYNDIKLKNLR